MTVVDSAATWVVTRNCRSVEFSALTWAAVKAAACDVLSAAMSVVLKSGNGRGGKVRDLTRAQRGNDRGHLTHSELTFCHPSP